MNRLSLSIVALNAVALAACSSSSTPPTTGSPTGTAGHMSSTASGSPAPSTPAGSKAPPPVTGGVAGMKAPVSTPAGTSGGTAGTSAAGTTATTAGAMASAAGHAGGTSSAGAGGMHAAAGSGGSTGAAGGSGAAGNSITGTLGALGPVQPVLAGFATTNGLETLIYLSSAPSTCAMMMTSGVKWLSKLPAGSQVIEIVVGNPSSAKTYNLGTSAAIGGGEVNYAEGSKSSSTEVVGRTGKITFTKGGAMAVQEGTIEVTAPFMASGAFHAEWCQGGSEY